jgi:hypothetical protein
VLLLPERWQFHLPDFGGRRSVRQRLSLLLLAVTVVWFAAAVAVPVSDARAASPGLNGKIVFVSGKGSDAALFTINPDGSGLTRLFPADGVPDTEPTWSPDGRHIAWIRNGAVWVADADGLGAQAAEESAYRFRAPVWAPDGRSIYAIADVNAGAYTGDRASVFRINTSTKKAVEVTPDAQSDYYYKSNSMDRPQVFSDGSLLLLLGEFDCTQFDPSGGYRCSLGLRSAPDGSNPQTLWLHPSGNAIQPSGNAIGAPDLAPSGDAFVATTYPGSSESSLDLFTLGGTITRTLTQSQENTYDRDARFSPDGSTVVFTHEAQTTLFEQDHGAQTDLYFVGSNGADPRPLTVTASISESEASWQPQPSSLGTADLTPPVIRLRSTVGRPGKYVALHFVSTDRSRLTRETVSVYRGTKRIAWFYRLSIRDNSRGNSFDPWQVPLRYAGLTLRYCMTASDQYGNRSQQVCAPLRVQR